MGSVAAKARAFRAAFRSRKAFVEAIETKRDAAGSEEERNPWKNEDLDVSPPSHRTWTALDYAGFWTSYGISPGTWNVGSALIAVGLQPYQAVICLFVGYLFGGIGAVLHSRSAAVYHIGFPVESRVTFGLRGAYFPIVIRVMTALIWTGVSVVQGGYHTAVVLRCIFGDSFWRMHNTIPARAGITLPNFVGLIVYWILTFPLLNVPLPKFRRYIEAEAVLMPLAIFGLFIYCMVEGKGAPQKPLTTNGGIDGSSLGWAMVAGINSIMGKTSTLVVNQPDIARYAKHKTSPVFSQLVALPVANTVGATLGIFATNSIYNKWGGLDWNPWILSHDILDHHWGPGARAAMFFANGFFVFAQCIVDMGANIIPFGADFMTLFPRWLNINRGMWVAYILSLCINPWYILNSASGFLTFLGGYSIFLGPFVGIFVTDYFVLRRGNIATRDLFEPSGQYWYTMGLHWRAFTAWVIAVAFAIPGFSTAFGHKLAGMTGWVHLYKFSWFYVVTVASVVYFALAFVGNYATEERSMPFEAMARNNEVIEGAATSQDASEINVSVAAKV
ncbi:allantoin [Niveomyces insectorum RCEF 264]|uniref:Allantoin n=1 Tax=Niveomyces insectorum RCEF 264 TaxID=1081102 RepID=A0A167UVX3_9HYPO|nr:allantoin [Niveomyces insectorum RCEF 264]